jgi:hypothetical protein
MSHLRRTERPSLAPPSTALPVSDHDRQALKDFLNQLPNALGRSSQKLLSGSSGRHHDSLVSMEDSTAETLIQQRLHKARSLPDGVIVEEGGEGLI